jgi:hypothetical protein
LKFVSDIRIWLADRKEQERRKSDQEWLQLKNAKNDDEWRQAVANGIRRLSEYMLEYDKKFKVTAIIIHGEILSRLPPETASPEAFRFVNYEFPTNFWGVAVVVDNLEWLGKELG